MNAVIINYLLIFLSILFLFISQIQLIRTYREFYLETKYKSLTIILLIIILILLLFCTIMNSSLKPFPYEIIRAYIQTIQDSLLLIITIVVTTWFPSYMVRVYQKRIYWILVSFVISCVMGYMINRHLFLTLEIIFLFSASASLFISFVENLCLSQGINKFAPEMLMKIDNVSAFTLIIIALGIVIQNLNIMTILNLTYLYLSSMILSIVFMTISLYQCRKSLMEYMQTRIIKLNKLVIL